MKFRNPENGYVESRSAPWLWAFLFGGLYFLVFGIWRPFLLWIVISSVLFSLIGQAAIGAMVLIGLCFSIFAPISVRNSYLRKGWVEEREISLFEPAPDPVPEQESSSNQITGQSRFNSEYRKCPFCAEEIRREAIKCKHCGSMVEAEKPINLD